MPSHYGALFDEILQRLRSGGLTERPVRVRTVTAAPLKKHHGCTVYGDYCGGKIRIARGLSMELAIETLIHEFAHHVDQHDGMTCREDHRDSWGKSYAKCFRAVYGRQE